MADWLKILWAIDLLQFYKSSICDDFISLISDTRLYILSCIFGKNLNSEAITILILIID